MTPLNFSKIRLFRTFWPILKYKRNFLHVKQSKFNVIRSGQQFEKTHICTSCHVWSQHVSKHVEESNSSLLVSQDQKLVESMQHIFPEPRSTLKNYYHLNKGYNCEYIFEKTGKDHSPTFTCTLHLNGPIFKEFCGHNRSKKSAEAAASLKALSCLYADGQIDSKGKPLKFIKSRFKPQIEKEKIDLLRKKIPILLCEEYLLEIEDLIHRYKMEVAPIILRLSEEEELASESAEFENEEDSEPLLTDLMTGKLFHGTLTRSSEKSMQMIHHLGTIMEKRRGYSYHIDDSREEILEVIANNPVIIIEGATGCGKSTQVPQMILDEWTKEGKGSECNILVAQPRRLATYSIAHWVALNRRERIGKSVGYKMRLGEQLLNKGGGIMFYTCGTLREMMNFNPCLEGITHVVIDEVHERTLDVDVLLLLLKRMLLRGSNVKLILMSATARVDELKSYFDTDRLISIQCDKPYPVTSYHIDEIVEKIYESSYSENKINLDRLRRRQENPCVSHKLIVKLVEFIHETKPDGTILVFLPGWNEIITLKYALDSNPGLWVLPLHSRLTNSSQKQIFERNEGMRKVILATNIAETSLTIDDVVYIVDSGIQKDNRYDLNKNISTFGNVWITKANVVQRTGRVGRVKPGEVFRLYDTEVLNRMEDFPQPEILKVPLESLVVRCKSLCEDISIRTLFNELINTPDPLAVEAALETLTHLGILRTDDGKTERLTPLGRALARISTTPILGKALVYSAILRCSDPALNFVALENRMMDKFREPIENADFRNLKESWNTRSDHLAMCQFFSEVLRANTYQSNMEIEIEFSAKDEECRTVSSIYEPNQSSDDSLYESKKILKLICPERLKEFIDLKELFRMQLNQCLPKFHLCSVRYDRSNETFNPEEKNIATGATDSEFSSSLSTDSELVLASFLSTCSSIIRRVIPKNEWPLLVTEDGARIFVHRTSVLSDADDLDRETQDELFFATNIFRSGDRRKNMAKEVSIVPPLSVAMFYGQDLELVSSGMDSDSVLRIKGRNVFFEVDKRTADCILGLRQMWNEILNFYVDFDQHPNRASEDSFDLESAETETEKKTFFEFMVELNQLLSKILASKT